MSALGHERTSEVRSLAGARAQTRDNRFTPESRHAQHRNRCPLSATSGPLLLVASQKRGPAPIRNGLKRGLYDAVKLGDPSPLMQLKTAHVFP